MAEKAAVPMREPTALERERELLGEAEKGEGEVPGFGGSEAFAVVQNVHSS